MKRLLAAARHPRDYDWGLRPWRRHSIALLVGGLVYVGVGIAYLRTEPVKSREESLVLALDLMALPGWGVVFVIVGVLAVISSRWPPASETWGYGLLASLASGWGACYLLGVIFGAPNQSSTGALLWGLVAFLFWVIAGMLNPDDTLVRIVPEEERASIVPPLKKDGGE